MKNTQPGIESRGPEPSRILTALVVIAWAVVAVLIVRCL